MHSGIREAAEFLARLPLGTAEEERARANLWIQVSLRILETFATATGQGEVLNMLQTHISEARDRDQAR